MGTLEFALLILKELKIDTDDILDEWYHYFKEGMVQ